MEKLNFWLPFSLLLVCIYAETLAANAVSKRISFDTAIFRSLLQNYSPLENRRGQIISSVGLTTDEEEELLEAIINIYDQTGDPEERAEQFQLKLYEMLPEFQNSVAIASAGKRSTGAIWLHYDISILIDQTLVEGFGSR